MTPEELGAAAAVFLTVMIGGLGLIVVFGVKLWKGIDGLIAVLRTSLGVTEPGKSTGQPAPDGPHRPQTGSFQAAVREEVEILEGRIDRRFDRMETGIEDLGDRQTAVEAATRSQGELIAKLSRSHGDVVRRTNEHSAALAIQGADQSMTRGAVQG